MSEEKIYTCKHCGLTFTDRYKLTGHSTHCDKNPNKLTVNNLENYNLTRKNKEHKKHKECIECNCKYCNKQYFSLNALVLHEIRCKKNENRIIRSVSKYNTKEKVNTLLTKTTDKLSKQKYACAYTYEYAKHIAELYSILHDFKINHYNLYISCHIHGWIKDFTWLKHKSTIKWTYETVYQEALKHTTLKSFRESANKAYRKAVKNNWISEYTWMHKNSQDVNNNLWSVYVYEIDDKYVYVGLTIDLNRRDYEHKNKEKDSLFKFCKNHNILLSDYPYKVIKLYLVAEEALQLEYQTIEYYKNDTLFELINKGKAGIGISSLGSGILKWDEKTCYESAKLCMSVKEYKEKYPRAYEVSRLNNWVNNYTWFINTRTYPIILLTKENMFVKFYLKGMELIKQETSFNISTIKNCLSPNTRNKSAYGYIWKRITDIQEIKHYINLNLGFEQDGKCT